MRQDGEAGAEWFISQAIFDADMTIKLLNDYGRECKARHRAQAPCSPLLGAVAKRR